MNDLKIKTKRDIDLPRILRPLAYLVTVFAVLFIISLATGTKKFAFRHVILFTICAIPLCLLAAYAVERLGSGLGKVLSGGTSGKIRRREQFFADLDRARSSKSKEQFEEALRIIDDIIEQDPDFPDALFLKGQILWEGFKRAGEALTCFRQVMEQLEETDPLHRWSSSYCDQIKMDIKD
ncbi:MAG: hypothetical protein JRJ85_23630 [Deltaproteobacteria bacterium]|nr:hypothetical protein [Deltaproteobacteria bacterium]